eukprot:9023041-Lingulodinium_polyedra.AAC.1
MANFMNSTAERVGYRCAEPCRARDKNFATNALRTTRRALASHARELSRGVGADHWWASTVGRR